MYFSGQITKSNTRKETFSMLRVFVYIFGRSLINNSLSILQCAFLKKYSTQHTLIAMIDKARKILHKGGTFDPLLTDLPKLFNCTIH